MCRGCALKWKMPMFSNVAITMMMTRPMAPRRYVTRVAMPRCPIMNSTDKLSDR